MEQPKQILQLTPDQVQLITLRATLENNALLKGIFRQLDLLLEKQGITDDVLRQVHNSLNPEAIESDPILQVRLKLQLKQVDLITEDLTSRFTEWVETNTRETITTGTVSGIGTL